LEGYGYDPSKADKLPGDLGSALDALEADADMAGILGKQFVETFLTYKRNELERFQHWVTDWEFREYALPPVEKERSCRSRLPCHSIK
jgi:glutamine synthetase